MTTKEEFYEELDKLYKAGDMAEVEGYILKEIGLNKMCCGRISLIEIAGHNELGRIYLAQGKTSQAVERFENACSLSRIKMGETSVEYASALRNLAQALNRSGDLKLAKRNIEDALKILEEQNEAESNLYAFTLTDAAMIAASMGDIEKAISYLTPAAELSEKISTDPTGPATAYGNLGMCCLNAGKKEEAKAALTKATSFAEQVENGQKRFGALYQALAAVK